MLEVKEVLSPDNIIYPAIVENVQSGVKKKVHDHMCCAVLRDASGEMVEVPFGCRGKIEWIATEGDVLLSAGPLARIITLESTESFLPTIFVVFLVFGGAWAWKSGLFLNPQPEAEIVGETEALVTPANWGETIHDERSGSTSSGSVGVLQKLALNDRQPEGSEPIGSFHAVLGRGGAYDILETGAGGETVIQRWEVINNKWVRELRHEIQAPHSVAWLGLWEDDDGHLTAYGWDRRTNRVQLAGEAGYYYVRIADLGPLDALSFDASGKAVVIGFGNPPRDFGVGSAAAKYFYLHADGTAILRSLESELPDFSLSKARIQEKKGIVNIVLAGTVSRNGTTEGLVVVLREDGETARIVHKIPFSAIKGEAARIRDARLIEGGDLIISGEVGQHDPNFELAYDHGHLRSRAYIGRWDLSGATPVQRWSEQLYAKTSSPIRMPEPSSYQAHDIVTIDNGSGGIDVGVLVKSANLNNKNFFVGDMHEAIFVLHGELGYVRRSVGLYAESIDRRFDTLGIASDGQNLLGFGATVGVGSKKNSGSQGALSVLVGD